MSIYEIANQLVAAGKGIMAADRPSPAFHSMLKDEGIPSDDNSYRNWSELLFLTPQLNEAVSGIIMTDEQVRLADSQGASLIEQVIDRGMIPGISPFQGMVILAGSDGETVGSGLDGLRERLAEYAAMGVGFTKWRAAFQIGPGTPSYYAIEANAYVMAQVAALSQEAGIVPIVEPEVMLVGDHSIEQLLRRQRMGAEPHLRGALSASRGSRRHAGQSQHGAFGQQMPAASRCRYRGRADDQGLPPADSLRNPRHRLPLRRTE